MVDLRYPIGPFKWSGANTPEQRQRFIDDIAAAPQQLRQAVAGLSAQQLETPYRPGGWSIRQVVHHVPESHMNSYVRFKLALTEQNPTVKPYDEALWAQLEDVRATPIDVSMALLESLHIRWVTLLRSLSAKDFERTFQHPEIGLVSPDRNLAL